MIRLQVLILLAVCVLTSCVYHDISKIKLETAKPCDMQLLLCLVGLTDLSKEIASRNKIPRVYACNLKNLDSNNDGVVEDEKLRDWLKRTFPNPNTKGYGVLDLEGKAEKTLHHKPKGSNEFNKALTEFLRALTIAQKERPNIKWGFYGLPFRDYWNRDNGWHEDNAKIEVIFQQSDVIYPSIYDFFKSADIPKHRVRDSLYVSDNVKEALKYGEKYNKPVLPFIWHRYHNSMKEIALERVEWEEMRQHITAALEAEVNGQYINGLVWWGDDQYFYNSKNKTVLKEVNKHQSYQDYHNSFTVDYLVNITNMLSEHCESRIKNKD